MNVKNLKLMFSVYLFSSYQSAFADSLQAMHCPERASSSLVLGCEITETMLADKTNFLNNTEENEYRVAYEFDCSPGFGPDTLDVRVVSGQASERLNFGESGAVVVVGRESLYIKDFNKQETKDMLLDSGCSLKILETSVRPSSMQVNSWKELKNTTNSELETLLKHRDVLKEMIILYPGFFLVKELSERMLEKLSGDSLQSLREKSKEQRALLTRIIVSGSGIGLSSAEVKAIATLQIALVSLGDPTEWVNADGSPKSLSDWLGSDDKEALEHFSGQIQEDKLQSYRNDYEQISQKVVAKEVELNKIQQLLDQWGK